jgi:hypothetical protein
LSRVFLFALTAALNPTLLTATTVMLLLPSPKRLLLGYWLGAMTTGVTVGLAIVHWLNESGTVSTTKHTVDPVVDLVLGSLALLIALVVGTGRAGRGRKGAKGPKKIPRWQQTLARGSARSTFVVGVLLSFPGASYLASLTEMHRQQLGGAELALTLLAVNLIMLVLLELPLIGYVVAPVWTPLKVEQFKGWFARNGRHALAIGAAVIGIALIVRGVVTLAG